jgi:trehalose utilization protein
MPTPYAIHLPQIDTDTDTDTAKAFDELGEWIEQFPSARSCWTIDRLAGKWRVGLQQGHERYSASQDAELRGAIRNALMIAAYAGCL